MLAARKELAPYDPDWYFVRAGALVRPPQALFALDLTY